MEGNITQEQMKHIVIDPFGFRQPQVLECRRSELLSGELKLVLKGLLRKILLGDGDETKGLSQLVHTSCVEATCLQVDRFEVLAVFDDGAQKSDNAFIPQPQAL